MGFFSFLTLAFLGFLTAGPFPKGVGALSCPGGWIFYQGSCYGLFQDRMTWADAEIDCQSQGRNAHLASIANRAEGAILAKHIKAHQQSCVSVWIGLHDAHRNGRWRWSDRSLVNFKNWLAGMPDNSKQKEYCGSLWCKTGYIHWNDADCKAELSYICKFEL